MTLCASASDALAFQDSSLHRGDDSPVGPSVRHQDSLLTKFIELLLPPDEARKVLRGVYTHALHRTLLHRLAALRDTGAPDDGRRMNPLPKWRLKRVFEFIDANIEERISLGALAQVAGISRGILQLSSAKQRGFAPTTM